MMTMELLCGQLVLSVCVTESRTRVPLEVQFTETASFPLFSHESVVPFFMLRCAHVTARVQRSAMSACFAVLTAFREMSGPASVLSASASPLAEHDVALVALERHLLARVEELLRGQRRPVARLPRKAAVLA
jgi:hypothetical protein